MAAGESRDAAPPDFVRVAVHGVHAVCAPAYEVAVRGALEHGTLYQFAESRPDARLLAGRAPVFAVPFPDAEHRVVVRHNHHGGAFARMTRDLFRAPGRAPLELAISERLRALGVPTPAVVAYAVYRAPFGLCRSDVVTSELPDSFDLSAALMSDDAGLRERAWTAALELVRSLADARARHSDLNVKNVLLRRTAPVDLEAVVLDVDRVVFGGSFDSARDANLARLVRSARKWRDVHGAHVTDVDLSRVEGAAAAGELSAPARARTP
jgi:hypothetical protein